MAKTTDKTTTEDKTDEAFDSFAAFFMQPSMDVTGIVDFARQNAATSAEIGKIYSDGTKDVISRGVDSVKDNMKEFVDASQGLGGSTKQTADMGFASGIELFQSMAAKNIAVAREMTDLMVLMNQKAVAVMQKRAADSVSDLRPSV